ncbi:lipase 1 [Hyalella azteca]|uniref:Lipase 1 n=1 Tax=Hyalella azteca TaxID=294128 RepID=A0A8B7N4U8_HYAAZ|nr:lipase 1 [Hyalella azteca]
MALGMHSNDTAVEEIQSKLPAETSEVLQVDFNETRKHKFNFHINILGNELPTTKSNVSQTNTIVASQRTNEERGTQTTRIHGSHFDTDDIISASPPEHLVDTKYHENLTNLDGFGAAAHDENSISKPPSELRQSTYPKEGPLTILLPQTQHLHRNPSSVHHLNRRDLKNLPTFSHSKSSVGKQTQPPEDLYLQVPELIRRHGYPAEVHDIRTSDDYILTLHRIVGPQNDNNNKASRRHDKAIRQNRQTSNKKHDNDTPQGKNKKSVVSHEHNKESIKKHDNQSESTLSRDHRNQSTVFDDLPNESIISNDSHNQKMTHAYLNEFNVTLDDAKRRTGRGTVREKEAVLLMHGFASSSADFVLGGPDSALGFMLADAGYDVWLGNFRGNAYSRRHASLQSDDAQFWRFSLDEVSRRDVPAMVDHIITTTHRPHIFYIGHSIGATMLALTCHIKPKFANKIRHFSAMAPVGYGKMSQGPVKVMTNLARITYKHKEEGGGAKAQVLSRDRSAVAFMWFFCGARSLAWKLCLSLLTAAGGRNTGLFRKEMLSLILAHFPAGTSVRLAAHLGQLLSSDGLHKFDFGPDDNAALYGQATPPRYDLSHTRVPTAVYWAVNDLLAPPQDVEEFIAALPNVTEKHLVGHETFNHFDFVYSDQARHLLHTDLITTMAKYGRQNF